MRLDTLHESHFMALPYNKKNNNQLCPTIPVFHVLFLINILFLHDMLILF